MRLGRCRAPVARTCPIVLFGPAVYRGAAREIGAFQLTDDSATYGAMMAHILLVEDDHQVSDLLREILEGAGHSIDCARTFAEAEARLASRYDLLICDVILPGGSGYQIAKKGEATGVRALL